MGFKTPKAPKVPAPMAPIRANAQDIARTEDATRRASNPQAGLTGTFLGTLDDNKRTKKSLFGQA